MAGGGRRRRRAVKGQQVSPIPFVYVALVGCTVSTEKERERERERERGSLRSLFNPDTAASSFGPTQSDLPFFLPSLSPSFPLSALPAQGKKEGNKGERRTKHRCDVLLPKGHRIAAPQKKREWGKNDGQSFFPSVSSDIFLVLSSPGNFCLSKKTGSAKKIGGKGEGEKQILSGILLSPRLLYIVRL